MLALTTTGKVLAWGSSGDGQRGEGLASQVINQSYLPIPVVQVDGTAELSGIIGIKAGQNHSLAVTSTGDVLIWGGLGLLAI
jgi:alpha-tubulin suppressor-like RCC1 family protein